MDDDLTTLPELSLPIILQTIKARFARNCIFTNVSEIVISVNPFQYLDNVLGEGIIRQFHVDKSQAEIASYPPHLYSLARAAFRGAVGAGPHPAKNQSVLISGESGAGKTEATKLCLRYFASMSATRGGGAVNNNNNSGNNNNNNTSGNNNLGIPSDAKEGSVNTDEDSLEHKLMNANPILEALGNAKTLRNDNSSRFGKWVSLQLNGKGMIVGGSITKYLLEESRVVNVGPGERNYHIFYQVCKKFGADPSKFRYLASSCVESADVDDTQDFETVMDALRSIGMVHEDRQTLCNTVWGILHLGDIKFDKTDGADSSLAKDELSQKALKRAAEFLVGSVNEEAFSKLLLKQVVQAGHETVITPRTEEQARTTRDSIAKMLYARLFDYTVWKINGAIELAQASGQKVATSIGILDIFGFESFEINSFEQLCINYANEKLQLFFIDYLTTAELALYQAEGLDVGKMPHTFTNNQPCVDLLEKPNGVFSLIGDEVRSRTGNDMEFLSKLYREHAKHPCFEKPRVGGKGVFSVKHYAQLVEYTVTGFIDKNKSKVGEDVIAFFTQSQIPMIQSMVNLFEMPSVILSLSPSSHTRRVTSRGEQQASMTRANKHASLGHAFKAQLSDLVVSIESTKAHFIRCIKPNSTRGPQVLEEKMVERQLLTSGMVDAVTIRQLGYSDRLSYALFLRRYAPLVASFFAPLSTKLEWKKVQNGTEQEKVRTILQLLPASTTKHWQLGLSRVFYRLPVLLELEKSREMIRNNAAIALQRRVRGEMARRDFEVLMQVWEDLVVFVSQKRWEEVPAALEVAREVGFSSKQLQKFQSEWEAARNLKQAVLTIVQALMFACTPTLPQNKWFRDRVNGLESAAEQVTARKLRPNESLSKLVAMTQELYKLLATLWTVCTNQQMDASAGPKRAKDTILAACRDATVKRDMMCKDVGVWLKSLEVESVLEVQALLALLSSSPAGAGAIEKYPEIQSLCVRIDSLDQHFKESVTKLEGSVASVLGCDIKTIESWLAALTEKELGIPSEYFVNGGLEAIRAPLVQRLEVFHAEQRAREQAIEDQLKKEAAAAEAKAAAARLEPTPLPEHVLKPKLAGSRRKPQQMKSFPPSASASSSSFSDDRMSTSFPLENSAEGEGEDNISSSEDARSEQQQQEELSSKNFITIDPATAATSASSSSTSASTSASGPTPAAISAMILSAPSMFVPDLDSPRVSYKISPSCSSSSETATFSSATAAKNNDNNTATASAITSATATTDTNNSSGRSGSAELVLIVDPEVPSLNRMTSDGSEVKSGGESDSDESDRSGHLSENPTGFSSLLPVFHSLGTRLDRTSLPGPGTLGVVVHSCANLIFFATNFFVSVTYCHAKKTEKGTVPRLKKKRTGIIKRGAKVLTWNESLEFTSRDPSTDWIRLAVKEKGKERSHSKCLGEVRFRVSEIALMAHQSLGNRAGNSQLHRVWQLRGSVQGEITLTFSFVENYWAKEKMKKIQEKRARRKAA